MRDELVVLLLTNEAAKILDVSPETVRLYERQGRLRALKTPGGTRLFDRRDVIALKHKREEERSR